MLDTASRAAADSKESAILCVFSCVGVRAAHWQADWTLPVNVICTRHASDAKTPRKSRFLAVVTRPRVCSACIASSSLLSLDTLLVCAWACRKSLGDVCRNDMFFLRCMVLVFGGPFENGREVAGSSSLPGLFDFRFCIPGTRLRCVPG